jgi:hypothetical protein|tara:strand:+ start:1083 stop:1262 length:180 start_codon:yes stop_codon:yes gene_type:complete
MINKIEIDNNIIYYTKVNLFTQIKLYIFDKLPLYAIPKRQNKIIIVDPNCDLTEIDIKC